MPIIITEDHLDQALDTIDGYSDEQIATYFEKVSDKQPALFGYIVALTENSGDAIVEDVLYTCTSIYKTYELAAKSIPNISEEALIKVEENFSNEVNARSDFNNPAEMFSQIGLKQRVILNFILEVMLSDKPKDALVKSEELAVGVMSAFIFARSLDESVNGSNLKVVS